VTELEKQIIVSTKREAFSKAAAALEGIPDDKLIEALGQ
jgi:hypothetical protein